MLVHPGTDDDGLCDAIFHTIRQNSAGSVLVLGRMLDVLTRVAEVERLTMRLQELRRHADLVQEAAERDVADPHDLDDLRQRHAKFVAMQEEGEVV